MVIFLQQQQAQPASAPQTAKGEEGGGSDLWELYSQFDKPHPALANATTELTYSRSVVDVLLHTLVPYPHMETRTGRFLVGELITCNVLVPLVARLSNPDWLNLTIVDVFTKPSSPGDSAVEAQEMLDEDVEYYEALSGSWSSCLYSAAVTCDSSDMSSIALSDCSFSSVPLTSSEGSCQSMLSYEEPRSCSSRARRLFGMSPAARRRIAAARNSVDLHQPIRHSGLYQETDSELDSPGSDGKKISMESLNSEAGRADRFCECISPSDFCGLMCLEEEPFLFLGSGKRSGHPKGHRRHASQPPQQRPWPESPAEDVAAATMHRKASGTSPASLCLPPFKFDPLGGPEGPVIIQNLRITGTVLAKEHRGMHPYTLYTVKVRICLYSSRQVYCKNVLFPAKVFSLF